MMIAMVDDDQKQSKMPARRRTEAPGDRAGQGGRLRAAAGGSGGQGAGERGVGNGMRWQRRRRPRAGRARALATVLALAALALAVVATMCPATAVAQSAQECSAEDAKEAKKKAGKLRSDGDDAMMKKQYAEALALYSEAISVEPNNEKNYYKRYKVHDKTGKHKAALEDIDHALEIKPDYLSAIGFRARTLMSLGRCMEAVEDFGRLLKAKPTHGDAKKLLPKARECARELGTGEQFMRQRNFAGAEKKFTDVMDNVGTSAHVKQLRAEARFRQGKFYESIADAGEVLKADPDNQEALLLRGRGYYLVGDHEMALRHFREGLKKDPEHVATKEALRKVQKLEKLNKDADAAVARGTTQSLKDAASLYAEAVKVDPEHREFNKKISTKLCAVHARLKQVKEAKLICEQAIRFDKNGIEPYVSLAELLSSMAEETPDFEEAVRAWHRAAEVEHDNRKVRDGLHRAEVALKQSKQKNYYKILGVARNADGGTIKKAYRKLAKETHPDRHGEKTEEERKVLQEKFELIAESYEVLSDDELRAKYDRGEDVFENQGNNQRQQHGGFPFRFHRRRP